MVVWIFQQLIFKGKTILELQRRNAKWELNDTVKGNRQYLPLPQENVMKYATADFALQEIKIAS